MTAKILIVEDDPNLLEGIRAVLELEDYTVLSAENGEQALQVLARQSAPPDLIVSDIMMPRMDGIQLLDHVRQNSAWLTIPFIFLTARSEKSDVMYGKRLGADDYLVKPFDADDLLVAVESRLKRHRLLHQAKTDEISDMKKKILTILNHEFRTPLTFLVAYTDMINEQQREHHDDPDAVSFLRGINVGAVRLRRLIENFIHLVEMETGDAKRIYDMRKVPLQNWIDVLRNAQTTLLMTYPERKIEIDIADDVPIITADPEYLTIALIQLLENAIKFSRPDQPVKLGAERVHDEIMLWVKDYGRGIDERERARIWESFYQINRALYEDQGAGSGLPIVRGVARLHGGRVDLDSELGKGSTFKLFLPVQPAETISVDATDP
jgi:signal transduction histidine kinase